MPEIMFNGPAGRMEGRYHHQEDRNSPIVILLHSHPHFGGSINNPVIHALYYMFIDHGFSALRFNFRGVGRSQGLFDNGAGELADAASALDWLQANNREARDCWIVGFSFGAWISMQLLMRRPEISGFMSIAPLARHYDFSFLAPCPASGIFINGEDDTVATPESVETLVTKLRTQKNIVIEHTVMENTNHFFADKIPSLTNICDEYLAKRMGKI